MVLIKAIKMRIYPTDEQKSKIDTTLNHCRYVYNTMLERNTKIYKRRGEHLNTYDMHKLLTGMKKYLPWLAEADSQALNYACKQLNNAYERFFKHQAAYPKFHSKRGRQSYTTTYGKCIHVEPRKIKVPCVGWVRTSDNRIPEGKICYATVSRETDGKYMVSVTYKKEVPDVVPVVPDPDKVIGLDYKSDGLFMDSNGTTADMPHFYRDAQKKRAKLQRQLSKKYGSRRGERKSNNYMKQLRRLCRQETHIANQRKDFLHKLSTEIANQYDAVCIEDLDMRAMSNKGFGNGKATMDNGYGMFQTMLDYKLSERGKQLVKIDRWYPSSQICHVCGHKQKMPIHVRAYQCPKCGMVYDRDWNAAINIKAEGLRLLSA